MKSKGIKRNIASLLAAAAALMAFVPALAPYQEMVINLAGLLGGAGLLHAAGSGTLTVDK